MYTGHVAVCFFALSLRISLSTSLSFFWLAVSHAPHILVIIRSPQPQHDALFYIISKNRMSMVGALTYCSETARAVCTSHPAHGQAVGTSTC